MGCYSGIGVIILLYFVVFVLNIVKTPKQMNCFGVLQRFQAVETKTEKTTAEDVKNQTTQAVKTQTHSAIK